jgi:hypothetical protein
MYKKYTIPQMIELKKQGWRAANPVTDWKKAWQQQADAQGYVYKAPNFDPAKDLLSPEEDSQNTDTYVAGMQNNPDPKIQQLLQDPEMQQMASQMGVSVNDLLVYREMMLDRYAGRYQNTSQQQEE